MKLQAKLENHILSTLFQLPQPEYWQYKIQNPNEFLDVKNYQSYSSTCLPYFCLKDDPISYDVSQPVMNFPVTTSSPPSIAMWEPSASNAITGEFNP